jgi:hypothetical protein
MLSLNDDDVGFIAGFRTIPQKREKPLSDYQTAA